MIFQDLKAQYLYVQEKAGRCRIAQQHTLDLDEHKEQDRENARRTLSKGFILMTSSMYREREYREYTKYIFKAIDKHKEQKMQGEIWHEHLLYIAIYHIYIYRI